MIFVINYDLRQATMEDKEFVYSLKKLVLKDYIDEIWGWDEDYQRKDFEVYYNPVNNKIITWNNSGIGILETTEDSDEIHIIEIAILQEYQGTGIGTNVLKQIIDNSKARDKRVKIVCFRINVEAKKLYLKLGFKVVEETKTHYILELK